MFLKNYLSNIIFCYLIIISYHINLHSQTSTTTQETSSITKDVLLNEQSEEDDTLLTLAQATIALGITLIGVYIIYKITAPNAQPINNINQLPTQPIIINTSTYNRQYQSNPPPVPNPFTYNTGQHHHQTNNVTGRTNIEQIINDNTRNINVRSFLAHVIGIPFNAPNQIYINDGIRHDVAQIIHQNLYGGPELAAIINVNHYFE